MTAPAQIVQGEERPYSVPQLAERWGCSEGLVRKLIREGRLHCFRPGSLIRISVAEVERFECQMHRNSPSSASEAGSPSSIDTPEGASDANSTPRIERAQRQRPALSGSHPGIVRGPWAGA